MVGIYYKRLKRMLSASTLVSLERALSQGGEDFRPVFKTAAERYMEFLYLNGREDVAELIKSKSNPCNLDSFLRAVAGSAHLLFDFPLFLSDEEIDHFVGSNKSEESRVAIKRDLVARYKEQYSKDFKKMHEAKKLIMQLFRENGYCPPEHDLLMVPKNESDKAGQKAYDVSSEDFVAQFVDKIFEADPGELKKHKLDYYDEQGDHKKEIFVSFYQLTDVVDARGEFKLLEADKKQANKYFNTRVKNGLFYSLLIIACLIGFTEAFAPYNFATAILSSMGLFTGLPILIMGLAGIVGFAGFLVNAILFHKGSFDAFKSLFLARRSRFFYNAKGERLSWGRVAVNGLAVGLAFFAAAVITSLSFSFYSVTFPFNVAIFFAVVNVIGWTGLLTTAVMGTLLKGDFSNNILTDLYKAIKKLLLDDTLSNIKLRSPTTYGYLMLFVLNLASVAAMFALSVGVVTASFGVFCNAFMGVNAAYLNSMLSATGVQMVVAAAQLALGTFFVNNVCRSINFIRGLLVDIITAVPGKISSVIGYLKSWVITQQTTSPSTSAGKAHPYKENTYRTQATIWGKRLFVGLFLCAGLNAAGFAAGYFSSVPAYNALLYVAALLGLPTLVTMGIVTAAVLAIVIHGVAAVAYLCSSMGGNGFASKEACEVDERMHVYKFATTVQQVGAVETAEAVQGNGGVRQLVLISPAANGRELQRPAAHDEVLPDDRTVAALAPAAAAPGARGR